MRWKISRWATCSATIGPNWAALQPVPITPTRLPVRSTSCSQRAEWNAGPAKDSRPSILGSCGRFSWPTAEMTAFAWIVPSWPAASTVHTVHMAVASSHSTEDTSVLKRMFGRMPNSSTHSRKYLNSSERGL